MTNPYLLTDKVFGELGDVWGQQHQKHPFSTHKVEFLSTRFKFHRIRSVGHLGVWFGCAMGTEIKGIFGDLEIGDLSITRIFYFEGQFEMSQSRSPLAT